MVERPIIVLGAGGHAKVVADALMKMRRTVIAFAEKAATAGDRRHFSLPVEGGDAYIMRHNSDEIELALGMGMPAKAPIAGLIARRAEASRFQQLGYRFATVIHPSAIVGAECEIGEGAQVMAGVVVQPGTRIGAFAIVNTRASVDHDCDVGEGCHVAPGAVLGGGVKVGAHALVGLGAAIRQGTSIGRGALIGAGAVVVENVQEDAMKVGVPAR